jgi:hypothetical protein
MLKKWKTLTRENGNGWKTFKKIAVATQATVGRRRKQQLERRQAIHKQRRVLLESS